MRPETSCLLGRSEQTSLNKAEDESSPIEVYNFQALLNLGDFYYYYNLALYIVNIRSKV
jgi:hypothetical protein